MVTTMTVSEQVIVGVARPLLYAMGEQGMLREVECNTKGGEWIWKAKQA